MPCLGGPERIRTFDLCLRRAALYWTDGYGWPSSTSLTSHFIRLLNCKCRTVYVISASYLDLYDRVPMWALLNPVVEIPGLAQQHRNIERSCVECGRLPLRATGRGCSKRHLSSQSPFNSGIDEVAHQRRNGSSGVAWCLPGRRADRWVKIRSSMPERANRW